MGKGTDKGKDFQLKREVYGYSEGRGSLFRGNPDARHLDEERVYEKPDSRGERLGQGATG